LSQLFNGFDKKSGWAALQAIFSQTHLVTLVISHLCTILMNRGITLGGLSKLLFAKDRLTEKSNLSRNF
jgi:hypothetical protein